jgi:hypothetical protein
MLFQTNKYVLQSVNLTVLKKIVLNVLKNRLDAKRNVMPKEPKVKPIAKKNVVPIKNLKFK